MNPIGFTKSLTISFSSRLDLNISHKLFQIGVTTCFFGCGFVNICFGVCPKLLICAITLFYFINILLVFLIIYFIIFALLLLRFCMRNEVIGWKDWWIEK